jgi:hypothetical protein
MKGFGIEIRGLLLFVMAIGIALIVIGISACTVDTTPEASEIKLGPNDSVRFWHDDDRNVSCWIYSAGYAGGITCLPDSIIP